MKTKPILFSTSMVQAILEGRKTQTRRVIKQQPPKDCIEEPVLDWCDYEAEGGWKGCYVSFEATDGQFYSIKSAYKEGDILWVRETWQYSDDLDEPYWYRQKYEEEYKPEVARRMKWKPSIFMPKEAARIFLKVTDVRVQRLQDITEEDAVSEGVEKIVLKNILPCYKSYGHTQGYGNAVDSFYSLWESIHGKGSWDNNPWVWVYSFERIERPENF